MEVSLDGLITKIKQEGVAEADRQAKEIVAEGEEKAKQIITDARQQGEAITAAAKQEAGKLTKQAEDTARQAVRDVVLLLKEKIVALFDNFLKEQVSSKLSPEILKEIIVKLIENFRKEEQFDIEVILSPEDKERLEKQLLGSFSEKMCQGIVFKASPNLKEGFRIGRQGDNYYYDFSANAVMEAFKLFLNPKLRQILDKQS